MGLDNKNWRKTSERTNSGLWGWFAPRKSWRGHEGNYAQWMKDHPECDTSRVDYDPVLDTCLADQKAEEERINKENEKFDNESLIDEAEDEFTYVTDELQDEYDVPTIVDKY